MRLSRWIHPSCIRAAIDHQPDISLVHVPIPLHSPAHISIKTYLLIVESRNHPVRAPQLRKPHLRNDRRRRSHEPTVQDLSTHAAHNALDIRRSRARRKVARDHHVGSSRSASYTDVAATVAIAVHYNVPLRSSVPAQLCTDISSWLVGGGLNMLIFCWWPRRSAVVARC